MPQFEQLVFVMSGTSVVKVKGKWTVSKGAARGDASESRGGSRLAAGLALLQLKETSTLSESSGDPIERELAESLNRALTPAEGAQSEWVLSILDTDVGSCEGLHRILKRSTRMAGWSRASSMLIRFDLSGWTGRRLPILPSSTRSPNEPHNQRLVTASRKILDMAEWLSPAVRALLAVRLLVPDPPIGISGLVQKNYKNAVEHLMRAVFATGEIDHDRPLWGERSVGEGLQGLLQSISRKSSRSRRRHDPARAHLRWIIVRMV